MGASPQFAKLPTTRESHGHVLVLIHDFQRDHPTLRALRWQARYCATPVVVVDIADLDRADRSQLDGCRAIAAIGPDMTRAARLAIDNELLHLELGDSHDGGRLDVTLAKRPDHRPVIAATADERQLGYGLRLVHLEFREPFDLQVLDHRWSGITGPVTVELSDRRNGNTWITVRDGPAVVLSASPPLTSTLDVTPQGPGTIVTDGQRYDLDAPRHVSVAFPLRHRTIHLGP